MARVRPPDDYNVNNNVYQNSTFWIQVTMTSQIKITSKIAHQIYSM